MTASNPFEELPEPIKSTEEQLKQAIIEAVEKESSGLEEAGLLFSGGVDSTLLAILLKDRLALKCYCAGIEGSPDLEWAERTAKALHLGLHTVTVRELEKELSEIVRIVGPNIMRVGVAAPFYFCMREAPEKVFFSGLGTEELYAGYERHWKAFETRGYSGVEEERVNGLKSIWERDLTRDLAVAKAFGKELKTPFLEREVVARSLGIPAEKMRSSGLKKFVLRRIALELGVPREVVERPKKAAQYGSGVDKAIRKLAKKNGQSPPAYLESLRE